IKRLVLVASRYDDGLQDTIYDFDSLEEADDDTKRRLRRVANKNVTEYIEMMKKRNASTSLLDVIEACSSPIFVSSMAYNMSRKSQDTYSPDEQRVYENLNEYEDIDQAFLQRIGNI